MPQFQAALDGLKREHPGADIWVLTSEDLADQVREAGADRVVTHRASRLTISRLGIGTIARLRRIGFDHIAIPLMDAQLGAAANLLRLAAAVGAPSATICAGGSVMRTVTRARLRRLAVSTTLNLSEGLRIVWQMTRAACHRRRALPRSPHRPTRVLHIINSLGVGGAQTQFAELINRTPRQFEIDVLVLANDSHFTRSRITRGDVSISFLDHTDPHDGTIVDAIARHCRRGAYDIVHTWLPLANMVGAAGARLADVPRIVTSIRSLNPGHYPEWKQWWYRIGDVLSARVADVVIVNAQPLVRDHAAWAAMNPRCIRVVHNGIDTDGLGGDAAWSRVRLRDELGLGSQMSPVIGCIGRLSPEKDQATFIRALAVLRDNEVGVHGVLVGDGPCEPALRALVTELGLTRSVTFLGARKDARLIMAGLDVLALTSRIEGFPNVLLEAGFMGVPVVSTNAGGVNDVIDDADRLCACGDANAVAAAISTAISNRTQTALRAEQLQARCRRRFTADHMVTAWTSIYTSQAG